MPSVCRLLKKKYEIENSLFHFQLVKFDTLVINDKVYCGEWSPNTPMLGYSVLVSYEDGLREEERYRRYVDYIDARDYDTTRDLYREIDAQYCYFFRRGINKVESVLVWDLDQTLLHHDDTLTTPKLGMHLKNFKRLYKRVVLWSHGTTEHVTEKLSKMGLLDYFDLIISRDVAINRRDYPKGFGFVMRELNKKFGTTAVAYSCLIDDKSYNYQGDYTYFVHLDPKVKDYDIQLTRVQEEMARNLEYGNTCGF